MRADADEAVRRFAAENIVTPAAALMQGIARVLCGDLDGGDAFLEDAVSIAEEVGAPDDSRGTRCANGRWWRWHAVEWDRAEALAGRARTVLRQAGIEDSYVTPWSARCKPA